MNSSPIKESKFPISIEVIVTGAPPVELTHAPPDGKETWLFAPVIAPRVAEQVIST